MLPVETERRVARAAAAGGDEKRAYVRRIFSEIAPRYDLLNHVLSFNIDRGWRAKAIDALAIGRAPAGAYLDLCAGTLDVAAELAARREFRGSVLGADFAEPMLRRGRDKVRALPVRPVVADALQLPLPDRSVAGVIVAFGVRNFADLDHGLREAHRVLIPGGRLVILEFSTPRSAIVRLGYGLYSRFVLPLIGRLVSGHPTAYSYLPDSVARFPDAPSLARRMEGAGFTQVTWETPTFGVVAVHVGARA
ncbi:MAG TPA: ubiquinone/menaquinone biosynthesis methyltransferase [Gemmatimonadaceae bacterium]|nr:ubiquinone/menaquinone biosynthesis methyltransferase [Gemmatimonadaceae bacterium]